MMREKMKARFEMVDMLTANKKIPTKIRADRIYMSSDLGRYCCLYDRGMYREAD